MADTSTFPTLTQVLWNNGPVYNLTAGADITAGMVVGFNATGVSNTVEPVVAGTTVTAVGVAIIDADSGDPVAVAIDGSVCEVVEGTGNAIDAGTYVMADDAGVKGCVKAAITTATADDLVGLAIEDISANGHGKIIVRPGLIQKAAT